MRTDPDDKTNPGSEFSDAHAEDLRSSDPEAYAAIYGDGDGAAQTDDDTSQADADAAAQADAAAAAAAAPADDSKPVLIPKARLDEVLRRMDEKDERIRALEERVNTAQPATQGEPATQQPATPAAPAFDLAAKLKEKHEAQWDGNTDRVLEIELEIEQWRLSEASAAALKTLDSRTTVQTQQQEFLQTAEQLVAEYPDLDSSKETANKEAINAVKAERDLQISAGKPPAVALRHAVRIVAEEYGLTKAAPKPAEGGAVPPPANTTQRQRELDAARKAAQIAGTPPNNVGGRGTGQLDVGDTREVSRSEWASLSQEEKDRRLGLV